MYNMETNTYNKIKGYTANKQNPFIGETMTHIEVGNKIIMATHKDHDLLIDSNGDVKGHTILAVKRKVDKAQFMKVYYEAFRSLYNLSKSALRTFGFIAEIVKDTPNKDTFMIDFELCKITTGYSRKTINSALAELIGYKFIARGPNPYIYYLNPTIFFNGDRLTLLETYELDESPNALQIEESSSKSQDSSN
jgi:hypothetical protein